MNFNKKELKKLKQEYEILVWRLVKNNKKVPKEYNDILDLIEDLELK